jgi:hypothetical protein
LGSGFRENQHYGTGVAFETLGFECAFTVEVDPEFPGDGDWGCPVVGFDRTGGVMPAFESRWGTPLVARVQPDSGQAWVAMFAAGGLGSYVVCSRRHRRTSWLSS